MAATTETTTAVDLGTGADTLAEMFTEAVRKHDGTAFRQYLNGRWQDVSFEELGETVREIAKGLVAIGIEPEDRVAILADTRPEWVYADFAAMCAGAVVVPVYHTSSADEVKYVLEHSSAKLVFAENEEHLEKIEEVKEDLPALEHVVAFEDEGAGSISLDDLREKGSQTDDEEIDRRTDAIEPEGLATIVYTSGTTGPPKGTMITHRNFRSSLETFEGEADPGEDPVFYAFLPLAHVLTRIIEFLAVDIGATIGFWRRDKSKLLDDLKELQPTHFSAVPRIFEKIYNEARGKAEGDVKEKMLDKAIEVGKKYRDLERRGESPGPVLRAEFELFDKQLFSKVRDLFGGNVRFAFTGAAPVAAEMLEFFYACGVLVLEGYGLTETAALIAVNRPDDFKFGTVGKPLPGIEVKIEEPQKSDDDEEDDEQELEEGQGEVLVKGPNIFPGYLDNQEETDEVLKDGWFRTEDLGSLDEDGFLKISGRTKDIIVTSSGKNITPTNIENKLTDHAYIGNAVVYGDDKNYLVALITVDEDERSKLAKEAGSSDDPEEMANDENVHQRIQEIVDEVNQDFAKIEQVKTFAILDRDLSQDEGELTPTMKVKRQVVYDKHEELFESLYDDEGGDDGS